VKLTTHSHVVPHLRMSGTKPLLPLYHFTTYTGVTLLRKSVIYSTVKFDLCIFICVCTCTYIIIPTSRRIMTTSGVRSAFPSLLGLVASIVAFFSTIIGLKNSYSVLLFLRRNLFNVTLTTAVNGKNKITIKLQ
jgi:hypothetical protein